MTKIISLITQKLIDENIIESNERDIYDFGLRRALIIACNTITIVIIGLIFKELLTLLVFTVYYLALRAYAGGYHCESELKCYSFSVMMILLVVVITKYTGFNFYIMSMILVTSITSIVALGPVENAQKKLDAKEKLVYRKKMLIRLSLELIGLLLAIYLNSDIAKAMLLAIGMIAVMLHLGCVKNKLQLREEYRNT